MDAKGRVTLCEDWAFHRCLRSPFVLVESPSSSLPDPLTVDEVVELLRSRWQASYDLQLVTRRRRMYLQVMWAYLEQQSFPLNEDDYRSHLAEVLEIVNRLGQAGVVRDWLSTTRDRPRLGKALSLQLQGEETLEEFLLRDAAPPPPGELRSGRGL